MTHFAYFVIERCPHPNIKNIKHSIEELSKFIHYHGLSITINLIKNFNEVNPSAGKTVSEHLQECILSSLIEYVKAVHVQMSS